MHFLPQDQMLYVELLAFEDQELFGWFLERAEPADSAIQALNCPDSRAQRKLTLDFQLLTCGVAL